MVAGLVARFAQSIVKSVTLQTILLDKLTKFEKGALDSNLKPKFNRSRRFVTKLLNLLYLQKRILTIVIFVSKCVEKDLWNLIVVADTQCVPVVQVKLLDKVTIDRVVHFVDEDLRLKGKNNYKPKLLKLYRIKLNTIYLFFFIITLFHYGD